MFFILHPNNATNAQIIETMSLTLQIILTIAATLVALLIGWLLRRQAVRRLHNTVLDNWIIQTLGVLIVVVPLLIAALAIPIIWHPAIFIDYWNSLIQPLHINLAALLGEVIGTLLLIALGIGAARTIQAVTIRGLSTNRIDINTRTLIGRIFYILTLILIAFWILSLWNISLSVPVAALSVVTVAITFSIQDILKDLVCGFYILIERPFHIGDQISTTSAVAVPYTGTVEDVQLRATRLRLISGEEVTIPNALVFGGVVVNNTHYMERRVIVTAKMAEENFVKDETPQQILKAIQELEAVKPKPEPQVLLKGYNTDKQAIVQVRFWVPSRQLSVISDVIYTLHKVLPDADLEVSEPLGNV